MTNARSFVKKLNDLFLKHNWKIDSRETTPGAVKTWMKRKDAWSRDKVVSTLEEAGFTAKKLTDHISKTINGKGFELILQHPDMPEIDCDKSNNMFIAVYAGSNAEEYASGLDC